MSRALRNALYILLMTSFVLTACGGSSDDDDTPNTDNGEVVSQDVTAEVNLDEDDTTSDDDDVPPPQGTPRATADFVAPPIGVLGGAATEDPEPGAPEPLGTGFTYLFFEQIGGVNDMTLLIELYSDGRLSADGEQLPNAPQDAIQQISQLIDAVDFFGMQATFIGPPRGDDDFRYRMGVIQDGGRERMIQARDGYIPQEIINLFSSVRSLVNAPPPSVITPIPLEATNNATATANP